MNEIQEDKQVNVSINTGVLLGNYLTDIQNLLDIITFVYTGHESVREEQYENHLAFMNFHPAEKRKLPFKDAKERSSQWLITSFLTESINATGNFLDECQKICALYQLAAKGEVLGQEFNDVIEKDWKKFHQLGFPDKFDHLRKKFGVETSFEEHFLSLNRARNCLVHRKGIVSQRDTNQQDRLVIRWRTVQLVATSPDDGEKIIIDAPKKVQAGWSIGIRFRDKTKSFAVGDKIILELPELYQGIVTLFSFASELMKSIESYGVTLGIMKTES